MELYRNTINKISFKVPETTTAVTATASLNSDIPVTLAVEPPEAGSYLRYATIPYLVYDGSLKVDWSFNVATLNGTEFVTVSEYYEVVTPLLSDEEILELLEDCDEEFSAKDRKNIERNVRHIIQSITGQSFGKTKGNMIVRGRGDNFLNLPARLISYESIGGHGYAVNVDSDGWLLTSVNSHWVPEIPADDNGINIATAPIVAPRRYGRGFSYGRNFIIKGEWGWNSVPEAVKEAARLLVVDYAGDPSYRDRYLTSMTAADWRIQFEKTAFVGTGNARADQLLSGYVRSGWGLV